MENPTPDTIRDAMTAANQHILTRQYQAEEVERFDRDGDGLAQAALVRLGDETALLRRVLERLEPRTDAGIDDEIGPETSYGVMCTPVVA